MGQMFGKFLRPKGAVADVRELEYVSALHQSQLPRLRVNGTVSATDIQIFLMSRFGIELTGEEALDILRGLGGGNLSRTGGGVSNIVEDRSKKIPPCADAKGPPGVPAPVDSEMRSMQLRRIRQKMVAESIMERRSTLYNSSRNIDVGASSVIGRSGAIRSMAVQEQGGEPRENERPPLQRGMTMRKGLSRALRSAAVLIPEEYVEEIPSSPEDNEGEAGDTDIRDEEYIDLVQMTSIILMPTLARAAAEWKERQRRSCNAGVTDEETGQRQQRKPGSTYGRMESPDDSTHGTENISAQMSKMDSGDMDESAELEKSLRIKPELLIEDVLKMLLAPLKNYEAEVLGLRTPQHQDSDAEEGLCPQDENGNYILNEDLLWRLLGLHSEYDLASDRDLLADMVRMAKSGYGANAGDCVLDVEAFVRVLTSDLHQWDVSFESRVTSYFQDVYGFQSMDEKQWREIELAPSTESSEFVQEQEERACRSEDVGRGGIAKADNSQNPAVATLSQHEEPKRPSPRLRRTFAFIDLARDTQRSYLFPALLFVFYVGTVLTYVFLFQTFTVGHGLCPNGFHCSMLQKLWQWLTLAAMLMLAGALITVPISLGNNPVVRSWRSAVFAIILAAFYTASPFAFVENARQNMTAENMERFRAASNMMNSYYYRASMILTSALGCIVIAVLAVQLVATLIPDEAMEKSSRLRKMFTPATVQGMANSKIAGAQKVNEMLLNAHRLHPAYLRSDAGPSPSRRACSSIGHCGENDALLSFGLHGETAVTCGGFFWVWKRIFSNELFCTEGIWIPSRLIIAQVTQFFILLFIGFLLIRGTQVAAQSAAEAQERLQNDPFVYHYPQWVIDIVPTEEQVYYALYPASAVAIAVAVLIMLVYIPSTVGTILKFRSGVLPSLYDPNFVRYRINADTVFLNLGNVVYAMFGSSVLFFAVIALFLFLIIWPFSRPLMRLVGAWLVGLIITIILKSVSTRMCRKNYHQALFRKRPAAANVSTLLMECWHVGLGGGVLIGRLVQFMFATIFFIGRVDVPFLSEEVRLGGWMFDTAPTSYRKDLLVHDAHRHPWMERLACMYIMRLKHSVEFSSRAGAVWRLLFVVSLMPWLKTYRVIADNQGAENINQPEENECDSEESQKRASPIGGITRNVVCEAKELAHATYDTANAMT